MPYPLKSFADIEISWDYPFKIVYPRKTEKQRNSIPNSRAYKNQLKKLTNSNNINVNFFKLINKDENISFHLTFIGWRKHAEGYFWKFTATKLRKHCYKMHKFVQLCCGVCAALLRCLCSFVALFVSFVTVFVHFCYCVCAALLQCLSALCSFVRVFINFVTVFVLLCYSVCVALLVFVLLCCSSALVLNVILLSFKYRFEKCFLHFLYILYSICFDAVLL